MALCPRAARRSGGFTGREIVAQDDHGVRLSALDREWLSTHFHEAVPSPEALRVRILLQDTDPEHAASVAADPPNRSFVDAAAESLVACARIEHEQADPPLVLSRIVPDQVYEADEALVRIVDPERELVHQLLAWWQSTKLFLAFGRTGRRTREDRDVVAAALEERLKLRRILLTQSNNCVALDKKSEIRQENLKVQE